MTLSEALPILRARLQEIISADEKATPRPWWDETRNEGSPFECHVVNNPDGTIAVADVQDGTTEIMKYDASLIVLLRNSSGMARVMLSLIPLIEDHLASAAEEDLVALAEEWSAK